MARIVFYHIHSQDIGPVVRLARIVRAIKRQAPGSEITVFQAGLRQPGLETPQARWIQLPAPFLSRANHETPVRLDAAASARRAELMLAALARIQPDVFVTGFFPFGRLECGRELEPVLRELRRTGTRLCASLPIPYCVHPEEQIASLLACAERYHRILIHTPPDADLPYLARAVGAEKRISAAAFLGVFRELAPKLAFTGYVLGEPRRPALRRDPGLVVVHRGGGGFSFGLLSAAVEAHGLIRGPHRMIAAAGPASTVGELRRLRALAARGPSRGLTLRRYVPDLARRLAACGVCVGTAGSAAYELLQAGTPSLLVPFLGFPGRERCDQLARARMLRDLIGAVILDERTLTPSLLADEIERSLRERRRPAAYARLRPGWFLGGERSARLLLQEAAA